MGDRVEMPPKVGTFYADLEKLLRSQLHEHPGLLDLRLKLLELYFETRRAPEFLGEARALSRDLAHKARSREWQRVVSMGRMLAPGDPLFQDTGDVIEFVGDVAPAADAMPARLRFGDTPQHRPLFEALNAAYAALAADAEFLAKLDHELMHTANRPSSLCHAQRLSAQLGGAQIYFKREDLSPPNTHLMVAIAGQALVARRTGRACLVTAAVKPQQGVLTAAIAARLGLRAVIYLDQEQMQRQQANVMRMQLMGALVQGADLRQLPQRDLRHAALEHWARHAGETFLVVGLDAAPQPYTAMARDFIASIGRETRRQVVAQAKRAPDLLVARAGHNADAIGFFYPFLAGGGPRLVCVEGAKDLGGPPARRGAGDAFDPFGAPMGDKEKRVAQAILEGLEYPGVTREHAWLKASGRVEYVGGTAAEARKALVMLARHEGIVAAVETAYAVAWACQAARAMPADRAIVVMLAERSDKDIWDITRALGELL